MNSFKHCYMISYKNDIKISNVEEIRRTSDIYTFEDRFVILTVNELQKYMKKLLTSKAGATFNLECPDFTVVVPKDVVEIVFKVRP